MGATPPLALKEATMSFKFTFFLYSKPLLTLGVILIPSVIFKTYAFENAEDLLGVRSLGNSSFTTAI